MKLDESGKLFPLALSVLAAVCLVGCATSPPPRINYPTLENYQEAAGRAVNELLIHPSIANFAKESGRKPRLQVGQINNRTVPFIRIPVEQVAPRVNEALLDSGQITVFQPNADGARKMARDAFLADGAAGITKAGAKDEPDYFLQGDFMNVRNNEGRDLITFQLRLTDREQSMVWQRSIDVLVGSQARK